MRYHLSIDGGQGGETDIEATSWTDAHNQAETWARSGDWGGPDGVEHTTWLVCDIADEHGERDRATVQIDPDVPPCTSERDDHEWIEVSRHGHGGGSIYRERCRHCGLWRVTDTWISLPTTGEQGHVRVSYGEDADVPLVGEDD